MKSIFGLSFLTLALFIFTNQASAQVIVSEQFTIYNDHNLSSGTSAGVVPAANYNVSDTGSPGNDSDSHTAKVLSLSGLLDSTGSATSIGFNLGYDARFQGDSNMASPNNNLLYPVYFTRYTDDTPPQANLSLTITGLNASLTYDIYVYVNSPSWGNGSSGTVGLVGGSSFLATTDKTLTSFTEITAGNAVGNYVHFSGLTGATSQTITATTGFVGFTGFQVVEAPAAVPEPSTYALMGLGLVGLLFIQRRRFAAR